MIYWLIIGVVLLVLIKIKNIINHKTIKQIILQNTRLQEELTAEQILHILNHNGYNPIIWDVISILSELEKQSLFECVVKETKSFYEPARLDLVQSEIYYRRIG